MSINIIGMCVQLHSMHSNNSIDWHCHEVEEIDFNCVYRADSRIYFLKLIRQFSNIAERYRGKKAILDTCIMQCIKSLVMDISSWLTELFINHFTKLHILFYFCTLLIYCHWIQTRNELFLQCIWQRLHFRSNYFIDFYFFMFQFHSRKWVFEF